jgi:magnesium transporter
MPIVASMGGIGTTQTATVVVRGLALGDMTSAHLWRVLKKEAWLGLTTGIANAAVMAAIAYFWKGQILLASSSGPPSCSTCSWPRWWASPFRSRSKPSASTPPSPRASSSRHLPTCSGFFSFLGLATMLIRFLL